MRRRIPRASPTVNDARAAAASESAPVEDPDRW
jgi:hypothetical protein